MASAAFLAKELRPFQHERDPTINFYPGPGAYEATLSIERATLLSEQKPVTLQNFGSSSPRSQLASERMQPGPGAHNVARFPNPGVEATGGFQTPRGGTFALSTRAGGPRDEVVSGVVGAMRLSPRRPLPSSRVRAQLRRIAINPPKVVRPSLPNPPSIPVPDQAWGYEESDEGLVLQRPDTAQLVSMGGGTGGADVAAGGGGRGGGGAGKVGGRGVPAPGAYSPTEYTMRRVPASDFVRSVGRDGRAGGEYAHMPDTSANGEENAELLQRPISAASDMSTGLPPEQQMAPAAGEPTIIPPRMPLPIAAIRKNAAKLSPRVEKLRQAAAAVLAAQGDGPPPLTSPRAPVVNPPVPGPQDYTPTTWLDGSHNCRLPIRRPMPRQARYSIRAPVAQPVISPEVLGACGVLTYQFNVKHPEAGPVEPVQPEVLPLPSFVMAAGGGRRGKMLMTPSARFVVPVKGAKGPLVQPPTPRHAVEGISAKAIWPTAVAPWSGPRNFYDTPYDPQAHKVSDAELERLMEEEARKRWELEEDEKEKAKVLFEAAEGRPEPRGLNHKQKLLWRSFCTADQNEDHTLSKKEVIDALEAAGSMRVREMVRDYLKVDKNEDGRMDWEEFLTLAESYPELGDTMRSMSLKDRRSNMFDGTERHSDQSFRGSRRDELAYAPEAVSSWEEEEPPRSRGDSILFGLEDDAEVVAMKDGAATVIQSASRGRMTRKRTAGMLDHKRSSRKAKREGDAATVIQSVSRGKQARKQTAAMRGYNFSRA